MKLEIQRVTLLLGCYVDSEYNFVDLTFLCQCKFCLGCKTGYNAPETAVAQSGNNESEKSEE